MQIQLKVLMVLNYISHKPICQFFFTEYVVRFWKVIPVYSVTDIGLWAVLLISVFLKIGKTPVIYELGKISKCFHLLKKILCCIFKASERFLNRLPLILYSSELEILKPKINFSTSMTCFNINEFLFILCVDKMLS